MSALTGALGGDGAPACTSNLSKQDDHAEVIRTPSGRGFLIVRTPYMVNCETPWYVRTIASASGEGAYIGEN